MRSLTACFLSLWVLAISAVDPASAATYNVKPDGTGDFPTIQAAIDACVGGDVIQLADGVFVGSGNRNINYHGKAVTVRSLHGDPKICTIDLQSAGRGINFLSGEGPGSVLQGVTVKNGYSGTHGAGIWCDSYSSPTISNCILAYNHSVWTGAGLYCFLGSSPAVDHCVFLHNQADISGGGAQFDLHSNPVLSNCTFYGNEAPQGSGVNGDGYGTGITTLHNCIVANGLPGEAIFCGNGVTLTCCDLYANEGGDYIGCLAAQYEVNGNVREHPLFCDPEAGNVALQQDSPCAPFSPPNPQCDLIGAWPVLCPSVDYVCCTGSNCQLKGRDACTAGGGTWLPGLLSCNPNPCLPSACCLIEECQLLFEDECAAAGGLWMGVGASCNPNPCLMERHLVRPDGTGEFSTIQAAVDGLPDRSIIELADGTFTGDGNRDVSYRGKAVVIRSQNGDPERCIIDCQGSSTNPHLGFEFLSDETRGSVLEGVTIRNGIVGYNQPEAIQISEANPQIIGNVFISNGIIGGGTGEGPLVDRNIFKDFHGNQVAAISIYGTMIIHGNIFRDFSPASSSLYGIQITGTGYAVNTGIIEENLFENIGGCAVSLGGTGTAVITGDMRNNRFIGCGTGTTAAISIGGTGGVIIHASLTGNTILNGPTPAIKISGVSSSQQFGDFRNNTIVSNASGIVRGTNISHLEIHNTILWDNGDDLLNGQAAEIFCSDIGDGDFNGTNGNISADPLFCHPAGGDYYLQDGSPCGPFTPGNPGCDLMGAWPQGCELSDVRTPGPVPDGGRHLRLSCAPNPSTGSTTVSFWTPADGPVSLAIYTVDGRRLAVLWDGPRAAGLYSVSWAGRDDHGRVVGPGIYFARVAGQNEVRTTRIHLIR